LQLGPSPSTSWDIAFELGAVASSVPLPLPTFVTQWIVPAGGFP